MDNLVWKNYCLDETQNGTCMEDSDFPDPSIIELYGRAFYIVVYSVFINLWS